jgi:signal transduction histidine kinase
VLPLLEQVAVELSESAARAGMAVRVEGDVSVEIALRPRMLRTIAANLAENAIRYAGDGATLTLSVRRDDGRVLLAATDDGAGVSEDDVPRLFERFYRADRARASRGTGLGLSIVKHIVSSAGGTVEARSGLGQGLEVVCSFPTER